MLIYKGYTDHVEFDDEAGIFHGEVIDLRDVVTFQGKNMEELEQAFRNSIDDYLAFCAERNEEPDKPFTGKLTLQLRPELHRRVYVRALREEKSLDEWINERLAEGC